MDHHLLARVFSLQAEVLAFNAELEAQKAANKERELLGQSLAYSEKDFTLIADQMRSLSTSLFQLSF